MKGDNVKFLIENWGLILLTLTSGGLLVWPLFEARSGVSPGEAVLQMNREKARLVDVSEPDEFAKGHCSGAVNVPMAGFDEGLAREVRNKETPLIFVCPQGVRAGRAAALAKKQGYTAVSVMRGGFVAWKEANLPVKKTA
jgi:rhodanese-related sulfurtransferase